MYGEFCVASKYSPYFSVIYIYFLLKHFPMSPVFAINQAPELLQLTSVYLPFKKGERQVSNGNQVVIKAYEMKVK